MTISIAVDRLDPSNVREVQAAAIVLAEAFADLSALNAWDKQVMIDTYVHHLGAEADTWHAYLAKREGTVVGVAVVVPPGRDYTDVPADVQGRIPDDVAEWQREVLFPATHRLDEESFGPDGMEPFFHLALLGVDPEARRYGVGKALLDHLIANAGESRATMSLNCEANGLIDYYRRFGFVTLQKGDVPISLDGKTAAGYCMIRRSA